MPATVAALMTCVMLAQGQGTGQAQTVDKPRITSVVVNNVVGWSCSTDGRVTVNALHGRPGDEVVVEGVNFGPDARHHMSQVTINRAAPTKAVNHFHRHHVDRLTQKQWVDYSDADETQEAELLEWTDTRIRFRVPAYATTGWLVVTVQEVTGVRSSVRDGGPLSYRPEYVTGTAEGTSQPAALAVYEVDRPRDSNAVRFEVRGQEETIARGRELFFHWPQYSQVAYALAGARLEALVEGDSWTDLDGRPGDPGRFGWLRWPANAAYGVSQNRESAHQARPKAVELGPTRPAEAITLRGAYRNIAYPIFETPPRRLPRVDLRSWATDWIGIPRAEFHNLLTGGIKTAVGISCASCHTSQVNYPVRLGGHPDGPVVRAVEVVSGLANPEMDFHGAFVHLAHNTAGGRDLRRVAAAYGPGVLDFTSAHEDDGQFNPVTIGSHFGREALQRLSTGGLGGSIHHRNHMAYIHHGALGRPTLEQSVALQTYINSLQAQGEALRRVGLYNYLEEVAAGEQGRGRLVHNPQRTADEAAIRALAKAVVGTPQTAPEQLAALVATADDAAALAREFPDLAQGLARGRRVFTAHCARCHTPSLGLYTSQAIVPLTQIGSYLPPSDRMLKTQGIRVAPLTHIYHRGRAGYLHDNHIGHLEDQFDPQRGKAGSVLYERYYRVSDTTRRIIADTPAQRRAVETLGYFRPELPSEAPRDPTLRREGSPPDGLPRDGAQPPPRPDGKAPARRYVYDYEQMTRTFGIREYGRPPDAPLVLPTVPHPYFVADPADRAWLVLYLHSL